MKLSIILPVYNVAKFIPDCLDSLLCQDIAKEDYEIICVNDGSPDNSVEVIEGYTKLHSNIKIISQPNSGVCVARNNGLDNATGKYVWFVDPDDYIAPNCLGRLLSAMDERGADLITFDYFNVEEESRFNPQKATEIEIQNQIGYSSKGGGCQYICRRQYLLDNGIVYNKELAYGEDYLWAFQINYRKHIGLETKAEIYYYRQRQGSAMHNKSEDKKRRHQQNLWTLAKIYEKEYVRCKKEELPKSVLREVQRRKRLCCQSIIWDGVTLCKSKQEMKELLAKLKADGLYPYRFLWWHLTSRVIQCNFLVRLAVLPFPIKPYVYLLSWIMRKLKRK
ncbi:MAG: glycosyltransferase family 2 protein [Clostridia bacterium]|nr:glycosyltransferase family 2 protein [Clostridia bacterium]